MGENCARLVGSGRTMKVFEAGDEALQKLQAAMKKEADALLPNWGAADEEGSGFTLQDLCVLYTNLRCGRNQHRHKDYVMPDEGDQLPEVRKRSLSMIVGLRDGNALNVWSLDTEDMRCVCTSDGRTCCAVDEPPMVVRFGAGDIVLLRGDVPHGGARRDGKTGPTELERIHVHLELPGMPVRHDTLHLS
jgi:hypothetical protein